jgi:hypothetical protein
MQHKPTSDRRRTVHRTFVVLPLFLAICAYSLKDAWQVRADLLPVSGIVESGNDRRSVVLPSGARVLVLPGASFDASDVRMISGEALFSHASLVSVQAGLFTLEGWNGAFSVSVQGESVTVAALTTPVVLQSGFQRTVVPIGTQLRIQDALPPLGEDAEAWLSARWVLPLPAFYIREQIAALDGLSDAEIRWDEALEEATLPAALDVLRLPASQERADAQRSQSAVRDVLSALRDDDTALVQSFLLQPSLTADLQTPEGKTVFPDILALAAEKGKAALFLPLISDDSLWLLASFHPLLRDHAWVTEGEGSMGAEARLLRLAFSPRADILPSAMSSLAADRWKEDMVSLLEERKEQAVSLLDTVLPRFAEALAAQASAELPERTLRYSLMFQDIAFPYKASISPRSLTSLAEIRALPERLSAVRFEESAPVVPPSSAGSASSSSERVMGVFEYGEGKEKALGILKASGGMQTEQTSVTVIHGDTVHVIGMVFSTDTGDRPFEFTFDAGAREVRDILKDGKVLPYGISLEQFIEWAKHGMQ